MRVSKAIVQTNRFKLRLSVDTEVEIVRINLSVVAALELRLTSTEEYSHFVVGIDVSFQTDQTGVEVRFQFRGSGAVHLRPVAKTGYPESSTAAVDI